MNLLDKIKSLLNRSYGTDYQPKDYTVGATGPAPEQGTKRPTYDAWKESINDFYGYQVRSQSPANYESYLSNPSQFFPMLDEPVMKHMYDKTMEQRKGTEYLLPYQAFRESTGGKATVDTNKNLFGTLKQGEGSDPIPYNSFQESIDAQLGPTVLGGGANPNMNILDTQEPLTEEDIRTLYKSYNPDQGYLEDLIDQFLFFQDIAEEYEAPGVQNLMDKYDSYYR